jgi:outer membrane protein P1, putative
MFNFFIQKFKINSIFAHQNLELNQKMKKLLIPIALFAGAAVYAGGFRVSLQGVKQLAMAHTSAHAQDASVAFFNPAGISFIPSKLSIAVGGFGVGTKISYQNPSTLYSASTNSPLGTPIYAAVSYKITKDVAVGFSFTTPFGSTIDWGEDWAGEEIVQKMSLKSYFFQPIVSFKLADWVSLGGSYIYARGSVDWDKTINQVGGTLNLNDKKATGQGFSFGFYFQPNDKLDVSIAYRSPVDMKAKNGVATFNVSPALYTNLGLSATSGGKDKFSATLPLVDEYTIGATYKVTPKWQVSADFNYHGWDTYNRLVIDFENAKAGNQADRTISVVPKNFKNSISLRFGTQYMVTDMIAARLGYYFDESPYEDKDFIPETPSFDNNVITGGLGFKFNKFNVDVSGAYALMKSRDVKNDYLGFYGQAKGKAFYFGLGLSYNPF